MAAMYLAVAQLLGQVFYLGDAGFETASWKPDEPATCKRPVPSKAPFLLQVESRFQRTTDAREDPPSVQLDFSSSKALQQLEKSDFSVTEEVLQDRTGELRAALKHLWRGYKATAWGADEVRPIAGGPAGDWGEVGMFVLDTMDTLWLAGLKQEFAEGEKWIAQLNLEKLGHPAHTSWFEMTIRGLGGLLSAYALSGHGVFLQKATELGNQLLPGFPTEQSGHAWPVSIIDVHDPRYTEVTPGWHRDESFLADVGTNLLEFSYLSNASGDASFKAAADRVMAKLVSISGKTPLAPVHLDPNGARFVSSDVSVGAFGDSYFEYLLKGYLQSGRRRRDLLLAWKGAMEEMRRGIVRESADGFVYLSMSAKRDQEGFLFGQAEEMDHITCFVPGMLALAAHYVPTEDSESWWLPVAKELARTCSAMYLQSPSGLAPERTSFAGTRMTPSAPGYRLRPETLESLFYMHLVTGEGVWREVGWRVFQSIVKHTKTKWGFASAEDVTQIPVQLKDSEETFLGAETFKYALLLQSPPALLSLDKFVLSTEAHPFPIARRRRP